MKWKNLWVIAVLAVCAGFLRLYRLNEFMPFVGDQAWFYLSARDMMQTGQIPLVGITASRTWLHQGALITYIFGPILWLFNYHPLAPGVFTALIGVATTVLVYVVAKSMFDKDTAFVSALLYAGSPLAILNERMPYHISPTPLLSLLVFFAVSKLLVRKAHMFPVLVFLLAVLHGINLAGAIVWIYVLLVLVYLFVTDKQYIGKLLQPRLLITSILAGLLPLIPFVLYDVNHGFPQTVKFAGWMVFRVFGIVAGSGSSHRQSEMLTYLYETIGHVVFLPSLFVGLTLFVLALAYSLYCSWRNIQKSKYTSPKVQLSVFVVICLLGIFANGTPSFAYAPAVFPHILMLIAVFLVGIGRRFHINAFSLAIGIVIFVANAVSLNQQQFFVGIEKGYGPTLTDRIRVAQEIINTANGQEFSIIAKGHDEQYESATMNTEYLTWWLGQAPVASADLTFEVTQKDGMISFKEL